MTASTWWAALPGWAPGAITILGLAYFAALIAYIVTVRPVERWTIWALAGVGYGVLMIWAYGGGSQPKK